MIDTFAQTIASRCHNRKGTRSRVPQASTPSRAQKAPTARPIPAWGEAPCWAAPEAQGLKARPIPSIPQILLVALHPVLLQECAELFLKISFAMMRLLCIDVLNQQFQIRRPDGKRAVPPLPRELRQLWRLGLDPLRRGSLQFRNQLRDVRRSRQSDRKMHMVGNAFNAITFAPGVTRNRGEISVKVGPHRIIENRTAFLRTEDYMHNNECERQWHRHEYRSGLQPSPVTHNTSWGCAPCWYKVAPSALETGYRQTVLDRTKNRAGSAAHPSPEPETQESAENAPLHQPGATAQVPGQPNARGLKARPIPAWGAAPCWAIPGARGLKARHIRLIRVASIIFACALLISCSGCNRSLRIDTSKQHAVIHVETLGEYPTTVESFALKPANQPNASVFSIEGTDTFQTWNFKLNSGVNQTSSIETSHGQYRVTSPMSDKTFVLQAGTPYRATVCFEHHSCRSGTFSFTE
jgi:hypothetical protein